MDKDKLVERARELWEDAELRRLGSPWTTPTKFEGEVRLHFEREALRSHAQPK